MNHHPRFQSPAAYQRAFAFFLSWGGLALAVFGFWLGYHTGATSPAIWGGGSDREQVAERATASQAENAPPVKQALEARPASAAKSQPSSR